MAEESGWVSTDAPPAVKQDDPSGCGSAALVMVANHWSVPLSLDEAAELLEPDPERGVRLGRIRAAVRGMGLQAFAIRADKEILLHELTEGRPVIVGLILDEGSRTIRHHYELVVAFRPHTGEVATIDPARGSIVRSWESFQEAWEAAGRPALVVLPEEQAQARAPVTAP